MPAVEKHDSIPAASHPSHVRSSREMQVCLSPGSDNILSHEEDTFHAALQQSHLKAKEKKKSKLPSKEARFVHPVSPCICKGKETDIQQLPMQNLRE